MDTKSNSLLAKSVYFWIGILIAIFLIVGSLSGAVFLQNRERDETLISPFERRIDSLQVVLDRSVSFVYSISELFNASSWVSNSEFRRFTKRQLSLFPIVSWVAWAPRIKPGDKTGYLKKAAEHADVVRFVIHDSVDHPTEQTQRLGTDLHPLQYINPRQQNINLIGLDIFADPGLQKELDIAVSDAEARAQIWQGQTRAGETGRGLLIMLPVYSEDVLQMSAEKRSEKYQGSVIGFFNLRQIFRSLSGTRNRQYVFIDTTDDPVIDAIPGSTVFSIGTNGSGEEQELIQKGYFRDKPILVANREWRAAIATTAVLQKENAYYLIPFMVTLLLLAVFQLYQRKIQAETNRDEKDTALQNLLVAQNSLVEAEKMAALGNLVAGVAHEINTPVGIGVTAASHLQGSVNEIILDHKEGKVGKKQFNEFLVEVGEGSALILSNLQRAAKLISSFKRISTDQGADDLQVIDIKDYLDDTLRSLTPNFKHMQVSFETSCPEGCRIKTYPGLLAQIITNLATNSLIHGFDNGARPGLVRIDIISRAGKGFELRYEDNGAGISEENQKRIFEPFYTTNRGQGGSGLGLNIVYNLVTGNLKGEIEVDSIEGRYTRFVIGLHDIEE